ncbi:MAG: error-prone DNA polymerase [Planctomycetota bacterium]
MPDPPHVKPSPHPYTRSDPLGGNEDASYRPAEVAYAELQVTSNFTFLTGASRPEELVQRAAELGHRAAAIADRNTLSGVVRAHVAAREAGIPLAVGCRLAFELEEGAPEVLVFPCDLAAYGRLCRLLTRGKRRAPKGECHLGLDDLDGHVEGLLALAVPPAPPLRDELGAGFEAALRKLGELFGNGCLSLAASAPFGPDDRGWLARLDELARGAGVPLAATNDVHYHDPTRRPLQDVLVCIREGCTIDRAGFRLFPNAERHLKSPDEMARLFREHPGALARSVEIAERAARFGLEELRYRYPDEICPPGRTPIQHLAELAWAGAERRYPAGVPAKVRGLVEHELRLIEELEYAPYFLTVHDLVVYARSRGILCQGRGAAANSAVCYCLGVTAVDPDRIDLLFERFVSKERNEPPDIDIDFEHERREEVIQYIYAKYGRDRAALTAEVISYRGRSAIRDVGKALGFSLDWVDRLAKEVDWWSGSLSDARGERLRDLGLNPEEATVRRLVHLVAELQGFPRHLSQHVGGFVITHGPLSELVPIENAAMEGRTVIEWDKDDIDALGMLKVDCLGLGMLTCVRKAFELIRGHSGQEWTLSTVPPEDPAVYDMISAADTVGVFQIESRAQMSMLPRLRPRRFYDLVIEVAIVRPGPIQGNMVHPYLRRRNGEEPVTYPSDKVREVLAKTLGVPLFQEQAMALAVVGAGFTPGEADQLRRAMAAWKRKSDRLKELCERLMEGLVRNGYTQDFAKRLFDQIMGFGEYGFPESHAASFALIVYVSAWLKRHHPAAFAAALINSQPMGFYAPAQIVRDAREHDVDVRPVDVLKSGWDCRLEDDPPAVRLGMRLVKGLSEDDARAIEAAVAEHGSFADVASLHRASGAPAKALRRLAYADAFVSLELERQQALWQIRALRDEQGTLWSTAPPPAVREAPLPEVPPLKRVLHDYAATTLSLRAHPISFAREHLDRLGVATAAALRDESRYPNGREARTAGIVLVRQRPGTAKGIFFMTLEDETGVSNLIVRPEIFERDRRAARHATAVLAHGRIERAEGVIHLMTTKIESLDDAVAGPRSASRDFH